MRKINLNSLVVPKIFWPGMIILLAVCIAFYGQKEKEKSLRIVKEAELLRTMEAKRVVENKLTEAEKQITARDEEIKLALDQLEKEITARKDLEVQLVTAVQEKQNLTAQIEELTAKSPQPSKPIELEEIVIKTAPELKGQILSYDREHTFVAIDLGNQNNLKLGDVLSVYRDDLFIGKVQVEKLEETTCAAVILDPWKNVEFKENDMVKKL